MHKYLFLLLGAVLSVTAGACGSEMTPTAEQAGEPEPALTGAPAVEPTPVPSATHKPAPTTEPTATLTAEPQPTTDPAAIMDTSWLWADLVESEPAAQSVVPDPASYSITLRTDGTAEIQADCNRVFWRYSLEGSELVFDTAGPATLAFCGEESLDQQFLALLGRGAKVSLEDGRLLLNLAEDGGVMGLEDGGPAPEVEVPQEPVIQNIVWQWEAFQDMAEINDIEVPDPSQYTLLFADNGTVSIRADCNLAGGTYVQEGDLLTIKLGPSTLAFCGEDSLDQEYLEDLGLVATYVVTEGKLVLNLMMDAGNMIFGD